VLLYAGKKRHIRRVIKALGYELLDLQRIREGEWQLGNLKERERKVVRIRDYVHHKK
jgi:16S rRNA U516 pseudouridylate synthase RsuA-like enzyme